MNDLAKADENSVRLRPGALDRLRARCDLERVRRQGQTWSHRLLVLAALSNELPVTRVGVTASRRLGGAVERNRARRLMRAAWRAQTVRVAPGWDVVLIARGSMAGVKMQAVATALESLLRQARLVT